jgi:Skp family chaperone for outer membrane proteins
MRPAWTDVAVSLRGSRRAGPKWPGPHRSPENTAFLCGTRVALPCVASLHAAMLGESMAARRTSSASITKADLKAFGAELRKELGADIHALKRGVGADIQALKQDVGADIHALKQDVGADIQALKQDVGADIQTLKQDVGADIQALREDVGADIQALRRDLDANTQAVRRDLGADNQAVRQDLGAEIQAVRQDLGAEIQAVRQDLVVQSQAVKDLATGIRAVGVVVERMESQLRVVAESVSDKASAASVKEGDDRLSGRITLLEDVVRHR